MNAVDVYQIMDIDIGGNETAREWTESFFCFAMESRFKHRKDYAEKIAQHKELQRQLQNRDRVMGAEEQAEVTHLLCEEKKVSKSVKDDWKKNILSTWKQDFLGIMTFQLDLKDVPICSRFGAAVKPRRAMGVVDDELGNPFKGSVSSGGAELRIEDAEEWDDDDFIHLKEIGEARKRQKMEELRSM
jgi:hypothetical protein